MKKNANLSRGFTLIELMVVIVIIGILVAIALPNFMGAQTRARIAGVKTNMHTTQVMVESYGVDNGGIYPATQSELVTEAESNDYQKVFNNPFTGQVDPITDTTQISGLSDLDPGMVLYFGSGVVSFQGIQVPPATSYAIYGLQPDGDSVGLVKIHGNEPFVLTNS